MQLQYLHFEFSDEESGRGSFDAMATVAAARVPAVLGEINLVLAWAGRVFGPAAPAGSDDEDDQHEWNYELQAAAAGETLALSQESSGEVRTPAAMLDALTEVTFTLSGSRAFCDAFRQEFGAAE